MQFWSQEWITVVKYLKKCHFKIYDAFLDILPFSDYTELISLYRFNPKPYRASIDSIRRCSIDCISSQSYSPVYLAIDWC